MRRVAFALILLAIITGTAFAQEVTPAVPFAGQPTLVVVTPEANDARASACVASTLAYFAPYVVRPGDHLADLIAGSNVITVTQLAAYNCIDDPDALPVGATIWLPVTPFGDAVAVTAEATTLPEPAGSAAATIAPEATSSAALTIPTEAISSAALTPVAAATSDANTAQIQSFNTSAASITNTDSVTLAWSATGTNAYFYLCSADPCLRPQNARPVSLNGSIRFNNFQPAGLYRYRLDVDGAGGPVTQDVSITVACAQQWLGGVGASPRCPEDPARNVYGVWQPFEHGVMLWFSDTKQIYVMNNDGTLRMYEDLYVDGQPNPGDQAPAGRFTPVRGFGLIWTALGGTSNQLGWATAQEIGYDSARQAAGDTSYTTYIQGPGSTVYAVTLLPGEAVGYWSQVAW